MILGNFENILGKTIILKNHTEEFYKCLLKS